MTAIGSHPGPSATADLVHGGDLAAARRLFPGAPQPFVDLSTGINPYAYPLPPLPSETFAQLPDTEALDRLAAAVAGAYGAPSPAHVVAAPGTQILLPLVAGLVPPGRAGILGPTYSEHARAAALAGHTVTEVGEIERLEDADLAVVVNPNNPDGRVVARGVLRRVAARLARRGGLLVVDEAFMEVGPAQASLAAEVGESLMVLRSFGKFFGLAGLRLGFVLGAPGIAARLKAVLGPWAVSGPAIAIGERALADGPWIAATRTRLAAARVRLDPILAGAGLELLGGTSLFRLVRTPAAPRLFDRLGSAGILVRRFPERPTWLRFGIPADEAAWDRLRAAMAAETASA